ncbi:hypothetical protein SAMN05444679_10216 [Variovorax sp. CF079]|nr:hypothetical protein SAMN05444679_10216 [Variovorax sp. CF079]
MNFKRSLFNVIEADAALCDGRRHLRPDAGPVRAVAGR